MPATHMISVGVVNNIKTFQDTLVSKVTTLPRDFSITLIAVSSSQGLSENSKLIRDTAIGKQMSCVIVPKGYVLCCPHFFHFTTHYIIYLFTVSLCP